MSIIQNIQQIKHLTNAQFETARNRAIERVKSRIGTKPQRSDFKRNLSPIFSILDILALMVFIPAFFISSIHIITHIGSIAVQSYDTTITHHQNPTEISTQVSLELTQLTPAPAPAPAYAGLIVDRGFYVFIHQILFIFLSEFSLILFLVMFGITRKSYHRWIYLGLAVMSMIFILIANIQSNLGVLESIIVPFVTIGIGLKLESLIIQKYKRNHDIDERYIAALNVYELAVLDPTQHPDFNQVLANEIWDSLTKLKANSMLLEADDNQKLALVMGEIKMRQNWQGGESNPNL